MLKVLRHPKSNLISFAVGFSLKRNESQISQVTAIEKLDKCSLLPAWKVSEENLVYDFLANLGSCKPCMAFLRHIKSLHLPHSSQCSAGSSMVIFLCNWSSLSFLVFPTYHLCSEFSAAPNYLSFHQPYIVKYNFQVDGSPAYSYFPFGRPTNCTSFQRSTNSQMLLRYYSTVSSTILSYGSAYRFCWCHSPPLFSSANLNSIYSSRPYHHQNNPIYILKHIIPIPRCKLNYSP